MPVPAQTFGKRIHQRPSWLSSLCLPLTRPTGRYWSTRIALAVAATCATSHAYADTTWQAAGTADWFTPANWSSGLPDAATNAEISNGGTVQITSGNATAAILYLAGNTGQTGNLSLSGGTLTTSSTEAVGNHGPATFTQSGGTNIINNGTSLEVGPGTGGNGTYSLSGTGILSVSGLERIGYNGTGAFYQSGGTNTVTTAAPGDALYLGYSSGMTGTYSLSGGAFSINGPEYVGFIGLGTFTQSGGTNSITNNNSLYLGASSGISSGSYSLSGSGSLSVSGGEQIGVNGTGNFTQSGGTNTVTGDLGVAINPGYTGTYALSAGTATVNGNAYVGGWGSSGAGGTGVLTISNSGSMTVVGMVRIYRNIGTLNLSGGTLTAASLDTNGNPAGFNWTSGSLVVTGGSFAIDTINAAGTTRTLSGSQSLAVTGVLSLNAANLTVPTGVTISSTGALGVGNTSGGSATLTLNGGSVTTASATIGRQTTYVYQFVPPGFYVQNVTPAGVGTLAVSAGSVFTDSGALAIVNGSAAVSGGSVTAGSVVLGAAGYDFYPSIGAYSATGSLTISGGSLTTTGALTVTVGTFTLSGGSVSADSLAVGASGTLSWTSGALSITGNAGFTPSNANITIGSSQSLQVTNTLVLPVGTSLTLNGGSLTAGALNLTGGSFTWTSGTLNLTHSDLRVDSGGPLGSNVALGPNQTLLVTGPNNSEYIGYSGTGSFTQSGGTHTVSNLQFGLFLYLGYSLGSVGNYSLSNGNLMSQLEYVGYNGTGNFTQSGGTHNVSGGLYLGFSGSGTYTLNGGQLSVQLSELVGYQGIGSFTQSGGSHAVSGNLEIGAESGSGTYSLSDGSLSVAGEEGVGTGGSGTFLQTGGTNVIGAGGLVIGDQQPPHSSTFSLSAGTLTTGTVNLYSAGTFNQTGGTLNAATFNQSGGTVTGTLQNQGNFVYNSGTFSGQLLNQGTATVTLNADLTIGSGLSNTSSVPIVVATGRSVTVNGGALVNDGTITLAGNLTTEQNCIIGLSGTGTMTQSSGTLSVGGGFYLGYSSGDVGSFSLSSGVMNQISNLGEKIGNSGTGNFVQTGGTHSVSFNLDIGSLHNSMGAYSLSAGQLSAANERVGGAGIGTLAQSGGVNSLSGALLLGALSSAGSGTYSLSGTGTLSAASASVGGSSGGTGTFNISGGSATISGVLQIWNSASSTHLSGGTLTASTLNIVNGLFSQTNGTITGPGNITVSGGTTTLGSANNFSGGTSISAGKLTIAHLQALGTGPLTLSGGTAQIQNGLTSPTAALVLPSLALAGGTMDVTNNRVLIQSATDITAAIRDAVRNGQLTTSVTSSTSHLTTVGYLKGSDYKTLDATTTFGGAIVNNNDEVTRWTYAGDINLDGLVDSRDLRLMDDGYVQGLTGAAGHIATWLNGDVTGQTPGSLPDGIVDYHDFAAAAANIGATALANDMLTLYSTEFGAPFTEAYNADLASAGGQVAAPEPASLFVLAMGGAALLRRQRRC